MAYLSIIVLFFLKSIFTSGIFEGKMLSQSFYVKAYAKNEVMYLEYLNEKGKVLTFQGVVTGDSVFFEPFYFENGKFQFKISSEDEKIFLSDVGANKLIEIKKLTSNLNVELKGLSKILDQELDLDLIGNWFYLFSINPEGEKDSSDKLSGKGYLVTYQASGNFIADPNIFKDELRAAGINDFSYSDLPIVKYKTKNRQVSYEWPDGSVSSDNYLIRNDTLFTTSKQGYTGIHLRKNNK
jgi:hypothetical protein